MNKIDTCFILEPIFEKVCAYKKTSSLFCHKNTTMTVENHCTVTFLGSKKSISLI